MSRTAIILHRFRQAAASQSLVETSLQSCPYFGVPLRWLSCTEQTSKWETSTSYQIDDVDQYSPISSVAKICTHPLSSHVNHCYHHSRSLGFSSVSSSRRMYSSDARAKPEDYKNAMAKVSSTETSEVGATDHSGNTWIDILDSAPHSTIDATAAALKKLKAMTDPIVPCIQELYATYPDLQRMVIPLGGTLMGTAVAWFVMPIVLRKLHKYTSENPLITLEGESTKKYMSYQTSLWSALEDPAKCIITFMAFSQMAAIVVPSISVYLPQAWRGAFVVSLLWFLQKWKTNFIANIMTNQSAIGMDRDRLLTFDKVSSLALIALGGMALAEACGVPVQSILTVGGVGGVATAFAARDVLGNILSGLSLQFSKPFLVGDNIKIIVNKSRAVWRASVVKIPVIIEDLEKIPTISEEIKVKLRSNPSIDAPYCYLSRLESSHGELTIGCNIKSMRRDEWTTVEQDILLKAASIVKQYES
ncbi:mechanosensitive ion channel protein 1, mitochondrial-like isoform X2 [Oryza glaberrima]|uniref:mechanosensitive ion channel protein 1, mitochondrial-like isoform X2 n=1 Tax=Oryza glaberrima TaxID=4538 RepID=UPI00224C1105|nr:mechanosensitive ion channel protein 1, mitochondrial-like isoform X2 [Oryza glaberrima]